MTTKQCTKCKIEYPATMIFFPPDKRAKDGLGSWCRKCANTAKTVWQKKNKKHCKEYQKEYQRKYRQMLCGYITHLMNRIKQRCINPNSPIYKYYGGRGIKCCFTRDELYNWLVENDIDPRGLDIHRIDNNGNYVLDNIKFLTKSEHIKLHPFKK